jgi:hypothetical protein
MLKTIARMAGRPGDVGRVILLLWSLTALGLISLVFPAGEQLAHGSWANAFTAVGTGLFLAGASTLAGSVVGFLFGVPVRERKAQGSPAGDSGYQPNTNLEHISDWLTKIIVGREDVRSGSALLPGFCGGTGVGSGLGPGLTR